MLRQVGPLLWLLPLDVLFVLGLLLAAAERRRADRL
jgi:hypothetical protein